MNDLSSPSLIRRVGTLVYDAVLLVALEIVVALPLPLVPEAVRSGPVGRACIFVAMVAVAFAFFGWFWTHGGQTLGMRAWRVRIVRNDGRPMTWLDSAKRLVGATVSLAAFGLGFFWCLVDKQGNALHDGRCGSIAQHIPLQKAGASGDPA